MGDQVTEIIEATRVAGEKTGWMEGFLSAQCGGKQEDEPLADVDTTQRVLDEVEKFEELEFPVLNTVRKCLRDPDPVGTFHYFIEETDRRGREHAETEAAEKAAEDAAKGAGEGASGTEHEPPV